MQGGWFDRCFWLLVSVTKEVLLGEYCGLDFGDGGDDLGGAMGLVLFFCGIFFDSLSVSPNFFQLLSQFCCPPPYYRLCEAFVERRIQEKNEQELLKQRILPCTLLWRQSHRPPFLLCKDGFLHAFHGFLLQCCETEKCVMVIAERER